MVKPEIRSDNYKPPLLPSTSTTNFIDGEEKETAEKAAKEQAEVALVVQIEEQRPRKSPRICVFVGLFVFILLVGFLAVYLIGRTHGNKPDAKKTNMADDIAVIPPNTSATWKQDVSWETKEELFQLSDAIGSDDIIGLRPIYRKDLPPAYIAYWELKLNGRTGEKYVIISAAKETGDHRLAAEGPIPSPIDVMSDQAERLGYRCHRVYRLTPAGLMVCEDKTLRRIVAATNDIINTKSMFYSIKWRKLDKQVSEALPRYKKQWQELSKRVHKLPEWNRFKWLSMRSGKWPTTPPPRMTSESWEEHIDTYNQSDDDDDDNDDDGRRKGRKGHRHHSHRQNGDDDDDDEDDKETELGLRPGEVVRLPVSPGFREVRIRFSGFSKMMRQRSRKGWQKWQRRLCRVLCDACEGNDYTRIKQKYVKKTKMGDRYIKLRIESDSRYVRKQLQGQEIRFRIELKTGNRRAIIVNYGIVLKSSRHGRSVATSKYSIPHQELFPDRKHHSHGHCMPGSGPVAWAMLLGYYNNLADKFADEGNKRIPLSSVPQSRAATPAEANNAMERIADKLGSRCKITPTEMTRIAKFFEKLSSHAFTVVTENDKPGTQKATRRAVELLKSGIPVVVSKELGDSGEHEYAVATRLREKHSYYRVCAKAPESGLPVVKRCSPWKEDVTSEVYVHPGMGKVWNTWENADAHFVAALVRNKKET